MAGGVELTANTGLLASVTDALTQALLPPILEPCLAGAESGDLFRPEPLRMSAGPGGGESRRTLFDSLFSVQGPPEIRDPHFLPAVRRLAPFVENRRIRVLFAEGPGEPVPSVRFVTTLPNIDPMQIAPLVGSEIDSWAEWIPMLAAIEVYRHPETEQGEMIQQLVMRMEGMAAKMVGMGTVKMTHRLEEGTYGEVVQSRWELVDRDGEGDLAVNRGSWTFAPSFPDHGVIVVYEGHQVPRFVMKQNRLLRLATVAGLRSHSRNHLKTLVEHLGHRSADHTWTKKSEHRPLNATVVLEDV